MALYQVMFVKATEPNLVRLGMTLNELGRAFIIAPTRKCNNSCKKVPSNIARVNKNRSPITRAIDDQAVVAIVAYRIKPFQAERC